MIGKEFVKGVECGTLLNIGKTEALQSHYTSMPTAFWKAVSLCLIYLYLSGWWTLLVSFIFIQVKKQKGKITLPWFFPDKQHLHQIPSLKHLNLLCFQSKVEIQ